MRTGSPAFMPLRPNGSESTSPILPARAVADSFFVDFQGLKRDDADAGLEECKELELLVENEIATVEVELIEEIGGSSCG
jgi:hypothetical protein